MPCNPVFQFSNYGGRQKDHGRERPIRLYGDKKQDKFGRQ